MTISRKKKIVGSLAGMVIAVFVLREFGIVDFNWYQSNTHCREFSVGDVTDRLHDEHLDYRVSAFHNDQLFFRTDAYTNNAPNTEASPGIEFTATLHEPVVTGNWYWPLFKDFQIAYVCDWKSADGSLRHPLKGDIKGEATVQIRGVCSRRQAKKIALEYAQDRVRNRLSKL